MEDEVRRPEVLLIVVDLNQVDLELVDLIRVDLEKCGNVSTQLSQFYVYSVPPARHVRKCYRILSRWWC